jgi:hypothetical protein
MKRLALILMLILCGTAHAQELDIFDINDFVDPRELGAQPGSYGLLHCPCDSFVVSRFISGGVADFVDALRPAHVDVSFAHLATSFYYGPWQVNWKKTQLNRADLTPHEYPFFFELRGIAPDNKNTLQVGRYFTFGSKQAPSIVRLEFTWTQVEYRSLGPRERQPDGSLKQVMQSSFWTERGFEADIPYQIGGRGLVTSLVFVERLTEYGDAVRIRRATLLQRAPRLVLGRWSVDFAIAAGQLSSNGGFGPSSRFFTLHPSAHVISPTIPYAQMRVHIKYAPMVERVPVGPGDARWDTTSQIAVFVDRALIAKRFSSKRR